MCLLSIAIALETIVSCFHLSTAWCFVSHAKPEALSPLDAWPQSSNCIYVLCILYQSSYFVTRIGPAFWWTLTCTPSRGYFEPISHPTPDDVLGIPNCREITYGSGQRHLDCGPQTLSSLLPEAVLPLKAGTRVFSFTRSDLIKYSNDISKNIAIAFSEVL